MNRPKGLAGDTALIASIVAVSVDDAFRRGSKDIEDIADARAYFFDGRYWHHLGILGLPDDPRFLPVEFENE